MLGNGEFQCLDGIITSKLNASLNIAGEDAHVPDIERCIRTIKERTRCTYDFATYEISGAFMQSKMEGKKVHVKLEGMMVDVMLKIDQ